VLLLTEGQMSVHKRARLMLGALPAAKSLLGDRGSDSNWFRAALAEKGIEACIPSSRSRQGRAPHDTALLRQRHKITTMFGRLEDGWRIAICYVRCADAFFPAICIAAAVAFWL
jgi:transposase